MNDQTKSAYSKIRQWLPLSVAMVALLAGCTVGQGPAKESPSRAAAAQLEVRKLQAENANLKTKQVSAEQELQSIKSILEVERQENRRFREMMVTNFDLLEQSVAITLAKTSGKAPVVQPSDLKLPPQEKKTENQPDQPVAPKTIPGQPVSPVAEPEPETVEDRKKMAETEIEVNPAVDVSAPPVPATSSMSQSQVMPVVAEKSRLMEDPDLQPPVSPLNLKPHPEAKRLYEKGFGHFARKEYDRAIAVYEDFLQRFPSDIYSDNAQFWIAESYFRQNKLTEAETAYRKVLRFYEHRSSLEGYKTPEALYRLGVTFIRRKEADRARLFLTNVAERFPLSSAGRKAKRELGMLAEDTASFLEQNGPDS